MPSARGVVLISYVLTALQNRRLLPTAPWDLAREGKRTAHVQIRVLTCVCAITASSRRRGGGMRPTSKAAPRQLLIPILSRLRDPRSGLAPRTVPGRSTALISRLKCIAEDRTGHIFLCGELGESSDLLFRPLSHTSQVSSQELHRVDTSLEE